MTTKGLAAAVSALALSCGALAETAPARPIVIPKNFRGKVRVACVGDSITYGYKLKHREKESYPARLAEMLGPRWEVRNFGVSRTTMLKDSKFPYWKEKAFKEAKAFLPHVVVIMLGTNDSWSRNWRRPGAQENFEKACREMVDQFAKLPSRPRIWLCTPPPLLHKKGKTAPNLAGVIASIRKVAKEKHIPVIDIHEALSGHPELFPDKVHPNPEGARLLAAAVFRALTGRRAVPRPRPDR